MIEARRARVDGVVRAIANGPAEEPLAPTARNWRWWLRALRRRPWLALSGVLAFGAVPALRPLDHLHGLLPTLVGAFVLGVVIGMVRDFHGWLRHSAEAADMRAERFVDRRPVDVSAQEAARPEWSWRGPAARHAFRWSLLWLALAGAVGVPLQTIPVEGDGLSSDRVVSSLLTVLFLVAPLTASVALPLIRARRARALLATPLQPLTLRLLGVGRASQAWYAVRDDDPDGDRLVLPAFPGRSLLVAGDVVHAWAAEQPPRSPEPGTARDVPVTVVGPTATLWAWLAYAPAPDPPAPEPDTTGRRDAVEPA